MTVEKTLKITLKRSVSGRVASHKATVQTLGLRRLHQSKQIKDTPIMRGMLKKVGYLLQIEEVQ